MNTDTQTTVTATDTPILDGHVRLTNRTLERIHAALAALSQRRLSGAQSEKKVVILLRRYFAPAHQIYEELRNAAIRRHPAPEDSDELTLPFAINEARGIAIEDLLNDTQDIPAIPEHLYLTDADMPKPLKGELGDANQTGVADIKAKLDFLYPLDDPDEE